VSPPWQEPCRHRDRHHLQFQVALDVRSLEGDEVRVGGSGGPPGEPHAHGYVQTLRDREEPVRGDGRSAEVADVESEDAPVLDQDVTLAAATLARWREVPSVRLTRVWAPTGMTAPTVSSVVSTGWRLPRTGGSRAIHVSNGTRTSTRCARTRASSGSCPRSARSGSGSSSWRDTRRPSIAWLPRAVEGRRYVIP
jgi:hypothetical protein